MKSNIPLAMIGDEEKAVITSIEGGREFVQRISDMGLYAGAKVKVIKNDFSGPVIVRVLDSKIALGRGQAQKIFANLIV